MLEKDAKHRCTGCLVVIENKTPTKNDFSLFIGNFNSFNKFLFNSRQKTYILILTKYLHDHSSCTKLVSCT